MSCFYDALVQGLKNHPFAKAHGVSNALSMQSCLKSCNTPAVNATWNGQTLSDKILREENVKHINHMKPRFVKNYYACSSCDPALLLLCHLFKIKVCTHGACGNSVYSHYAPDWELHLVMSNGHCSLKSSAPMADTLKNVKK
jgi:hypothetical protein